jgi:polysaccharide export outer membrane protein
MNPMPVCKLVKLTALALVSLLLNACATDSAPPPPQSSAPVEFSEDYRIGVGDTVAVSVWRNDDLSITAPVRPDGKISVPLAGDVLVGDKTPQEVSAEITERIGAYIRDPFVTVIVTDMGSAEYRSRVRVTGAVERPVSLPYRQGMTVLDVVLEAGGINEFANGSKSTLFRRSGERFEINLDRLLKRGDMSTNFTLQPGDVITVPERAF